MEGDHSAARETSRPPDGKEIKADIVCASGFGGSRFFLQAPA